PCAAVVAIPAWEPVNDHASAPSLLSAIATSAFEMRSPAVSSMSISRSGGAGLICAARSSRAAVVSPIAEQTTTTDFPACLVSTIRSATLVMRSALSSDDPPYFWTPSATRLNLLAVALVPLAGRTPPSVFALSLPGGRALTTPACGTNHYSRTRHEREGRRA